MSEWHGDCPECEARHGETCRSGCPLVRTVTTYPSATASQRAQIEAAESVGDWTTADALKRLLGVAPMEVGQ